MVLKVQPVFPIRRVKLSGRAEKEEPKGPKQDETFDEIESGLVGQVAAPAKARSGNEDPGAARDAIDLADGLVHTI